MNIADRIARIEARLASASHLSRPVFFIALEDGDQNQPCVVEHAGSTWTQRDDESSRDLLHRAHADILNIPRTSRCLPEERFTALALVARPGGTQPATDRLSER